MKVRKWILLSTVITLACVLSAHARSPVWKVSKGKYHLFIGGTIHLLSQSDYPLPTDFESAYGKSALVVLETDIQKMKLPEYQEAVMKKLVYGGNRDIKQVLKAETFQALGKHLAERGVPIETMIKFKPGMLVVMLTMIEMQRFGLAGTGVDEFYGLRAINDGKELGHLETVDEQLAFLVQMGAGKEDALIAYTLNDLKDLPEVMEAVKAAWRKGDNEKLQEVALAPWKKDFPNIYQSLLVRRNNSWMPKIEAMLKTEAVEMVLVGALHLAGEEGVIAKLKARGYKVQQQ